ncbi:MAG: hypothetical protein KatS3mg105_0334 [Gemmatales bacterium]|nr:MAG: hypothetical protein KatS3mg105_0334 [Gemmatales bacterium]
MAMSRVLLTGFVLLSLLVEAPVVCADPGTQQSRSADRKKKKRRPSPFQSRLLQQLDNKLKFTPEQRQRIAAIKKEFEERNKEAVAKLRAEVEKIRDEMARATEENDEQAQERLRQRIRNLKNDGEKLRREFERKFLTVLTPEQKKQYRILLRDFEKHSPSTKTAKND